MTTGKAMGIGAGVLGFGMFVSTKGSKSVLLSGLLLMSVCVIVLVSGNTGQPAIASSSSASNFSGDINFTIAKDVRDCQYHVMSPN